jgi:hypothetical protein
MTVPCCAQHDGAFFGISQRRLDRPRSGAIRRSFLMNEIHPFLFLLAQNLHNGL